MEKLAEIRVRYAETDAMGIVYHANYLVWFEIARTELFRKLGLPYTLFEDQGLGLAVVEANVRYKTPARYDDLLALYAEVVEIGSRKVVFNYAIVREGTLVCQGSTTHVFINQEGRAVNAAKFPMWQKVKEVFGI